MGGQILWHNLQKETSICICNRCTIQVKGICLKTYNHTSIFSEHMNVVVTRNLQILCAGDSDFSVWNHSFKRPSLSASLVSHFANEEMRL